MILAVPVDAPRLYSSIIKRVDPGRSLPSGQQIVIGSLFGFCNGAAKGGQVGPE
jgi:hypothetical protein